jgi:hypothetical protein
MINLGLSSADLKLFQTSLFTPPGYDLKVTVQILDLNHNYLADVSRLLIGGQVNKSFWDIVTSGATLELMDPDNQVGFDTVNPSEGAIYADRMIRIVYSVFSPLLPRWVDVPLFCGPVVKVSRDDAILSLECQGKESLYVAPEMAWAPRVYPKGTRLTSCIKELLGVRGGETRFDLPEWDRTIKKDYTLLTETPIWDMARKLVGSRLIHQLFYDGRGYLRLRNGPTAPIFTFTEDHLTSVPKLAFDSAAIRNTVRVLGGTPTGTTSQITANAHLPASDPSSSTSLGRKLTNGTLVKRYLVELIEDGDIGSKDEAQTEANETLDSLDLQNITFDFDSFPIPHLEQGDVFAATTRDFARNLRAKEFSIPLIGGNSQSNGTYRRLVPTRRTSRKK